MPPDLAKLSLSEIEQALAEKRLPPVDKWHPAHCGPSDMRIARDGSWFHQGGRINRPAMVKLFASILRRELGFISNLSDFIRFVSVPKLPHVDKVLIIRKALSSILDIYYSRNKID